MSRVDLDEVTYRYVRLNTIKEREDSIGVNLKKLYFYIDQHKNMGRVFPYGNAYKAIRLRATQLLGRGDMKVYKREVTSLIVYKTDILKGNYVRIPYKMYYIFKAIFELVDELKVQYPLPEELEQFVGKIRRECFFEEQSHLFKDWYKGNETKLTKALMDDMMAGNSILSKPF